MSSNAPRAESVAAVVMTYKRPHMLKLCLESLDAQLRPVDDIIVIDNDPDSQGASDIASQFPHVVYRPMQDNLGPAGASAEGLRCAFQRGNTWAWLFNDDCKVRSSALQRCLEASSALGDRPGVIAGSTRVTTNGKPYEGTVFDFNGSLIHRDVITAVGYPRVEYFMCGEEHEYALRIRQTGLKVFWIRERILDHETAGSSKKSGSPPWRTYYRTRNELTTALRARSITLLGRWLFRQFKMTAAAIWQLDHKRARTRYQLLGIWHGLRGVGGRTVEPTSTGGH